MMSYEEYEKEIKEKINELIGTIKENESKRDELIQKRRKINSKIEDYKLQLMDLEYSKSEMLKYKYEVLINIIAGIPASIVTLIPFLILKFIVNDIELEFFKSLFLLISSVPSLLIAGIVTCPLAHSLFDKIKNRLLKKHFEDLENNSDFQLLLRQIEATKKSKSKKEALSEEKTREIDAINSNIKTYTNDLSELRGFLNFVTSKTTIKENTLSLTKTKEKEGK